MCLAVVRRLKLWNKTRRFSSVQFKAVLAVVVIVAVVVFYELVHNKTLEKSLINKGFRAFNQQNCFRRSERHI